MIWGGGGGIAKMKRKVARKQFLLRVAWWSASPKNNLFANPTPLFPLVPAVQTLPCEDWQGNPVGDGVKYIPNEHDPCTACVCDDGFPVMCTAVLCSPPECHLWEAVEGECCRFHCIEPDHAPSNKTKDIVIPRNTKSSECCAKSFCYSFHRKNN